MHVARIDTDEVLGGRYRLRRRIAAGGMGTVWEADDEVLHRQVAVKVISDALASDEKFVERFLREARAAAGLSHPNVAGVFDYGEDDHAQYIVLELLRGETLADRLQRLGRLPWTEAVPIAAQIAMALEEAHAGGIVHRDVKPGNIMLSPDGRVKVMDFGIASASRESSLTLTGAAMGTASYVAPEQASGERATPASDIYSLGVVLYEMLTGAPPFVAETPVAVAAAHIKEAPVPIRDLVSDVPEHVAAACERALAKDPSDRPASAAAFAAMLQSPEDTVGNGAAPASTMVLPRQDQTKVLPAESETAAPGLPSRTGPPRRGRGWLVLFLLAVAALAGILAFALLRGPSGGGTPPPSPSTSATPNTVPVPNVVGLRRAAAESQLRDDGFAIGPVIKVAGQPEDVVVRTAPSSGTAVAPGASVTLYVGAPREHEKGKGKGKDQGND
jgi:serine/threonine protein kinase